MNLRALAASPEHLTNFARALATAAAAANCQRKPYTKIKVPSFTVTGEMIAYASPDSTYVVTRRLLDAAKSSIRIGIYDFTAGYMEELLIQAMRRGVRVELLLDLEGEDERRLFDELTKLGCAGLRAPSCANKTAPYFSVVHQKIAQYYADIFESDWGTAVTSPTKKKVKLLVPAAFTTGKAVRIDLGDIAEV